MTADTIEVQLINKLAQAIEELESAPNLEAKLVQSQIVHELAAALAAIRGAR